MSDFTRDLLVRGIASAKVGERKEAQYYLEWLMRLDPPLEEQMEAWYWLSEVVEPIHQKRLYIEEILSRNPGDARARKKLAILDGKLKTSEIIDPDKITTSDSQKSLSPIDAQRFTCPNCGGKMTFSPDGQSLTCEYCESRQFLKSAQTDPAHVSEDNFIITLAKAKGHLVPTQAHSFRCQGCGSEFLLHAGEITFICPYCDSDYVIQNPPACETILPNGLLPFRLTNVEVRNIIKGWFLEQIPDQKIKISRIKAYYIPIWTFDIGGQITWKCEIYQQRKWVKISGQKVILHNDLLELAGKNFPLELHPILNTFPLSNLVPYDPRYFANWVAENFQVSVGDASLQARKKAYEIEKNLILENYSTPVRNILPDSSSILVDAYKLIYLPIWSTSYLFKNQPYRIAVNGFSGEILGEKPNRNNSNLFEKLFDRNES